MKQFFLVFSLILLSFVYTPQRANASEPVVSDRSLCSYFHPESDGLLGSLEQKSHCTHDLIKANNTSYLLNVKKEQWKNAIFSGQNLITDGVYSNSKKDTLFSLNTSFKEEYSGVNDFYFDNVAINSKGEYSAENYFVYDSPDNIFSGNFPFANRMTLNSEGKVFGVKGTQVLEENVMILRLSSGLSKTNEEDNDYKYDLDIPVDRGGGLNVVFSVYNEIGLKSLNVSYRFKDSSGNSITTMSSSTTGLTGSSYYGSYLPSSSAYTSLTSDYYGTVKRHKNGNWFNEFYNLPLGFGGQGILSSGISNIVPSTGTPISGYGEYLHHIPGSLIPEGSESVEVFFSVGFQKGDIRFVMTEFGVFSAPLIVDSDGNSFGGILSDGSNIGESNKPVVKCDTLDILCSLGKFFIPNLSELQSLIGNYNMELLEKFELDRVFVFLTDLEAAKAEVPTFRMLNAEFSIESFFMFYEEVRHISDSAIRLFAYWGMIMGSIQVVLFAFQVNYWRKEDGGGNP